MAEVTLTEVDAVLKKDIHPAVVDAVKQEALIYQIAKSKFKPQKFVNNKFYVPVKLNQSAGFTSYGATSTPTVNRGKVSPVEASFEIVQVAGSFTIDQPTLDSGKGAVVDTLSLQSEGVKDTIVRQLNFQLWREGGDTLFYANGAGTSDTTLVIDENRDTENGDIDLAEYLPVGSSIKIGSNSAVEVTAHTAKNTVTIASAQTWSDNDAVKVLDGDGNVQTYIDGLGAAVNTDTYGGIDPSSYAAWKSVVDTPGTDTTLALGDLDENHIAAKKRGKVDMTFANSTLYAKFLSLLQATRQTNVTEKQVLHGGWTGVDYMGHQFILDYDVPDDTIFNISSSELKLGMLHDLEFLKGNDGTLLRAYGKTEYEAIMYTSLQLVNMLRGAHGKIERRTA